MPVVANITTRDIDVIETVEIFQQRRNYSTAKEALEKLILRAREFGLHTSDVPLIPGRVPIAGTVGTDGSVNQS